VSPKQTTVAVLGGGSGAFAHAAHLALKGFRVNMYEVPELHESIVPVQEQGGITLQPKGLKGFGGGLAHLGIVSSDPGAVLKDAEVVWVVVPAYAQRRFAEACAPFFRERQIVVLTPGNGGALEFSHVLEAGGVQPPPQLVEAESMIFSCEKRGPAEVVIDGFKKGMGIAALPGTATPSVVARLRPYFPSLRPMASVLETQLSNVNTVAHPAILLLNAGRAESIEGFEFYREGATPAVGRILEAVDRERLIVGKGLGLELLPMLDWEVRVYGHQGAQGDTLADVLAGNPAYQGFRAPRTMSHRFLLEDVPFGLVPIERFGRLASVPTPITTSLISIASEIVGADLRERARDWDELGISNLSADELKRLVGHRKLSESGA
jgi:opine dehydrogenase